MVCVFVLCILYDVNMASDAKLHIHIETALKWREPKITMIYVDKWMHTFNNLFMVQRQNKEQGKAGCWSHIGFGVFYGPPEEENNSIGGHTSHRWPLWYYRSVWTAAGCSWSLFTSWPRITPQTSRVGCKWEGELYSIMKWCILAFANECIGTQTTHLWLPASSKVWDRKTGAVISSQC